MEVFGGIGLVNMVVQNYVEEGVHRHMVVVVDKQKGVHHNYNHCLGMLLFKCGEVVAKRIDHKHMPPPTFDCSILDAYSHYSSYFLQHS
ncbi:hypothetical protein AHAS_Ahas07G0152100 [Arachis hypogaea]